MFVFLFVYLELIEELAEATDLKFGMHVEHVVSRNNTKDISDIFTNEPLRLLALRELLFTLTCTRAFGLGKGENYL